LTSIIEYIFNVSIILIKVISGHKLLKTLIKPSWTTLFQLIFQSRFRRLNQIIPNALDCGVFWEIKLWLNIFELRWNSLLEFSVLTKYDEGVLSFLLFQIHFQLSSVKLLVLLNVFSKLLVVLDIFPVSYAMDLLKLSFRTLFFQCLYINLHHYRFV
jgi:hypothetical protein